MGAQRSYIGLLVRLPTYQTTNRKQGIAAEQTANQQARSHELYILGRPTFWWSSGRLRLKFCSFS